MIPPLPTARKVPRLLAQPFTKIPFPVQKMAIVRGLSNLFSEALTTGECDFLKDRWLKICVLDLNMAWFFSLGNNNKILISAYASEDVQIKGNLSEFILLASRKEDPDTLFFQRKLVIEGDTDLGLAVKNLIDTLDIEMLPREVRFFLSCAGEFINIFAKETN